jgi:acyl-CoA thioesterase-1
MRALAITILSLTLLAACGGDSRTQGAQGARGAQGAQSAQSAQSAQRAPSAQTSAAKPRIVFLGDSLTAGLGLAAEDSFPSLIGKKLQERGLSFEIVNAGVSGDTTAGGVRRLDWSLDGDVRVLVVALGANDGMRGLPTAEMKKNLAAILERARERKIPVILAGMEAPPNNGPEYTRAFRSVYTDLAAEYDVRFIPFLLQGVAGDAALNQRDGIHPNVRGAQIIADLVWAELEPMVRRPT